MKDHGLSKDQLQQESGRLGGKESMDEQLLNAEGLIRAVFNGMDEAVTVFDKEYRNVLSNRTFAKQVPLPFEEGAGENCFACTHHKSRPCYGEGEECPIKQTFETGEVCEAIRTHVDEKGNSIFLEVRSFPLRDSSGKVSFAVEITRDITEQRKRVEQLCHTRKMEALGTLVGGIAHDFNNLLNIIIGYGQIMRADMTEKSATGVRLDEILMAAHRATHITKNLLALSGQQMIEMRPVNINDIVNGMEKGLSNILGKGRELRTSLSGEDIVINADVVRIEQVLMNLAMNARDAMPEGGIFSVSTAVEQREQGHMMPGGLGPSGKFVVLTVSDTGMGLDEQATRRIFEPYFTTKGMDKNTGLGLSIVYGLIKQHDGFIDVVSHPGKGTAFKIYLPVISAELVKTETVPIPEASERAEMVLLVEDDSAARNITSVMMEKLGYRVIEAVDSDDAFKKFFANKDKIRLVILDVIMPEGSIRPVYDKMLLLRPDIKAIFLSGYTEDILKESGMIEEGLHFLAKPFLPEELAGKVKEVLAT